MADQELRITGVVIEYSGLRYTIDVQTPPVPIEDEDVDVRVQWSFSTLDIIREMSRTRPTPPIFKDVDHAERWLDEYASRP